jgi:hypothetical protein
MFCPVCEAEYEQGISHCPDDDVDLVEKLDVTTSMDDSEARFVNLHHFGSPAEAEMVNDILRQNGIRAAVQAGPQNALAPLLASSEGSIILVDERDLDRAQELYRAFFGEDTTPLTGTLIEEDEEAESSAGPEDD